MKNKTDSAPALRCEAMVRWPKWNDAKKVLPPDNKYGKQYLTVLMSEARSQHCKVWGGMGEVEITTYHQGWATGWNARGSLSVAYWMELPPFDYTWNPTIDGERGFFSPNTADEPRGRKL